MRFPPSTCSRPFRSLEARQTPFLLPSSDASTPRSIATHRKKAQSRPATGSSRRSETGQQQVGFSASPPFAAIASEQQTAAARKQWKNEARHGALEALSTVLSFPSPRRCRGKVRVERFAAFDWRQARSASRWRGAEIAPNKAKKKHWLQQRAIAKGRKSNGLF